MIKLLLLFFALTASTPLYAGDLNLVLRFKTYELETVKSKSSHPRVDKIFSACALLSGKKVSWANEGERAADYINKELTQSYFDKSTKVSYTKVESTPSGAVKAVKAILSPGTETHEFKEARVKIHRALSRALTRQPWLDLYVGNFRNSSGKNVFGFFVVVDQRNLELLFVGDGVCNKEHES